MKYLNRILLGTMLALGSCSLNLVTPASQMDAPGKASVHLDLAQSRSRTVDPTAFPSVGRYELTFTSAGAPKNLTTSKTAVDLQLATGTWSIEVKAYDSTTGGNLIGQAVRTVTLVDGANTFRLSLLPVTNVSGDVHIDFDWAALPYGEDADSVEFEIRPWSPTDQANADISSAVLTETGSGALVPSSSLTSGTYSVEFSEAGRSSAVFDAKLKSGTYMLSLTLEFPESNSDVHTELVKVYDNLLSTGHLNPVWEVSFDNNGAGVTGSVDAIAIRQGATVNLPEAYTLARSGYLFGGWNTQANGSGQAYDDMALYTMGGVDTTLFAQWKVAKAVTFDANGGTGSFEGLLVPANEASSLPYLYDAMLNPGYFFAGWSQSPSGPATVADGKALLMGSSDVTLYAQWKAGYGFPGNGSSNLYINGRSYTGNSSIYGTTMFPSGYLFFYAITPPTFDPPSHEDFSLTQTNEGSALSGGYPENEAEFRISADGAFTFSIASFAVYNRTSANQTINVQGWGTNPEVPVPTSGGAVSASYTVVPGWNTVNLSGFIALDTVTIDFVDNTWLYFNNFDVY